MINVNMIDKAGVTLATAGKYCADNVKVTPSAEILRKDEQAKTATPTTSAQDITPDAGKALSKVTVNPITAAIVGDLDASSFAASIVAAIEGKGVDVPSGAKLDALAALIESIEAGGGGLPGFKMISGTYTPTENMTSHVEVYVSSVITSSPANIIKLSEALASFMFVTKNSLDYTIQYPTSFCNGYVFGDSFSMNKASSSNSSISSIGITHSYYKTGTNKYVIKVRLVCNSKYPLVAGQTYAWMLIFPDDISL